MVWKTDVAGEKNSFGFHQQRLECTESFSLLRVRPDMALWLWVSADRSVHCTVAQYIGACDCLKRTQ
ncbi:MAG: hypothetical protein CSA33_06740 [Desulfobulbus propionicus]|nr:MAG: hypothetical protein CSA33_06740 [Desulfobulbus propionicus]